MFVCFKHFDLSIQVKVLRRSITRSWLTLKNFSMSRFALHGWKQRIIQFYLVRGTHHQPFKLHRPGFHILRTPGCFGLKYMSLLFSDVFRHRFCWSWGLLAQILQWSWPSDESGWHVWMLSASLCHTLSVVRSVMLTYVRCHAGNNYICSLSVSC